MTIKDSEVYHVDALHGADVVFMVHAHALHLSKSLPPQYQLIKDESL